MLSRVSIVSHLLECVYGFVGKLPSWVVREILRKFTYIDNNTLYECSIPETRKNFISGQEMAVSGQLVGSPIAPEPLCLLCLVTLVTLFSKLIKE